MGKLKLVLLMTGFVAALNTNTVVAADNVFYPPSCGNPGMSHAYTVEKYMRFYTSKATAERNVLLTPDNGEPTDKNDSHDILTGLGDPSGNGGHAITFYTDTVVDESVNEAVSIVVPFWFRDRHVDDEDWKLRDFSGETPRLYDPAEPGNSTIERNGGFMVGAYNYRCIVRIDPPVEGWQLAFVQGYIYRGSTLHLHVERVD